MSVQHRKRIDAETGEVYEGDYCATHGVLYRRDEGCDGCRQEAANQRRYWRDSRREDILLLLSLGGFVMVLIMLLWLIVAISQENIHLRDFVSRLPKA